MSLSLLIACRSLIRVEILCSLVLAITLALMVNLSLPDLLRQIFRTGNESLNKESGAPLSAGKTDSGYEAQAGRPSKEAKVESYTNINVISTNWETRGLKAAVLFALLMFSTLSWSSTTHKIYGKLSGPFHAIKVLYGYRAHGFLSRLAGCWGRGAGCWPRAWCMDQYAADEGSSGCPYLDLDADASRHTFFLESPLSHSG